MTTAREIGQRTEVGLRGLRDDMRVAARRPGPDGDNVRSPSVTLLAGNSLLHDVHEDTSTGGNNNPITVVGPQNVTFPQT